MKAMRGLHASPLQRAREWWSVCHVSGSKRLSVDPASVTVLTRVENGAYYVPSFVAHYRKLGAAHMIFLDTGSTDGTVEMLQKEPDVTVYRTTLPFKTHRLWMQRWLMDRLPEGAWVLNADIDELLEYPRSSTVSLPSLVSYFEVRGYNAMRAHMLDFFSGGSIGTEEMPAPAPLTERFPWYDLSNISEIPPDGRFGEMPAYRGGIRCSIFNWQHFWLTKHPLMKTGCGIEAYTENEHMALGARCADVTGALLHFKFVPRFRTYVEDAVRRRQHWKDSFEYGLYLDLLEREPGTCFKKESARRWRGVDVLLQEGFLVAGEAYRDWGVGTAQL